MSRNVVFNESVMFVDSSSTDTLSDSSDEEEQHEIGVEVELHDKDETEIVDNDVAHDDDVHDDIIVQHSPPVLQQQIRTIAADRPRRNTAAPKRLVEECDIVHYAFSCAEQVENNHEPSTYTEAVVSGDREKWISAMQEEMQSLDKMAHGILCACLNRRRPFAENGSSKGGKVYLPINLQGIRQG